ncbi:disease resistance protein L6-like [Rhodamnia argentea]|uniref:Disease resistance protein L6-like n=1 Tax=Rhodamnia argentea TaxID=178133 RepID=A0ABM3HW24_9MYRT|nr:disease resistance protein L6-like [Rhodamnia argentea]
MTSSDAGTSTGSEYQVFLSFRGPDTRTGFTDVLYHSLTDAGIHVFQDDEELRVGERIDGSLLQAIDDSRIYIPIFSQTYASSQWCLRELAHIMANTSKSEGNKKVLPIFFDVDPDDVKLKTPLYRDAILNLELEKKVSTRHVDAWRKALIEVDAIKGWEVKKYNGHGELINLVVVEVVEKLKTKHRYVTEYLVGIDDQALAVSKLVDINCGGVRFIQIHGMGGIGKTTLAKVVFNELSSDFGKCCCFLEDVRSKSSTDVDLIELQKKLLSEISHFAGTKSINEIDYGMKRIEEVLRNKKVLLVLDDVDNSEQVEKLIGKSTLYSGSRILITTRNKNVLQIRRAKEDQMLKYEMELMSCDHALELFSKHAFDRDSPLDEYCDLSREIVSHLGRLPLALEVIGSLLYHKKKQEQWKKTLEDLRKAPHDEVSAKLRISYDALSFEQQQIFLDIACFFIGEDKMNAIYMWEDCGFLRDDGVVVLNNMCLIKLLEDNRFWMHDQLRDFGREIVRQENPLIPGKRSRLWTREQILDTITTKETKRDVQALDLNLSKDHLTAIIRNEENERLQRKRSLKLNEGTFIDNLMNSPTEQIPGTMTTKEVKLLKRKLTVFLLMARKLKVVSLTSCDRLIETPNFSGCPNLERLTFKDCSSLRKIDSSIGKLKCLIYISISASIHLKDLPEEIGDLVSLQHLSVKDCYFVKLPDSIWKLKSLREVHFESKYYGLDSANSWELPSAVGMLRKLEVLVVFSRSLKGKLPYEIGSLSFLRILKLCWTRVSEVPTTFSMLPRLQMLDLWGCDKIQELPALPASLTYLRVRSVSLRVVPDLVNLTNLVELDLDNSGGGGHRLGTGELRWIGKLSKLNKLRLRLRNVRAPAELASLPLLNQLHMIGLDLQTFPELPLSLQELYLDDYSSIVSLTQNLRNLSSLGLFDSPMQEFVLDGLQLPNITELRVVNCGSLERITLSSMRTLQIVDVRGCSRLVEIRFSRLESLRTLYIQRCQSFEKLVDVEEAGYDNIELIIRYRTLILPLRALTMLQSFMLGFCPKILKIHIDGTSESLEYFILSACDYVQSLGDLSNLRNLKSLSIHHCDRLRVVKGLDELELLDELAISECKSLGRLINVSSTKLPNHCDISISGCREDFRGILESYKHHQENHLLIVLIEAEEKAVEKVVTAKIGNSSCNVSLGPFRKPLLCSKRKLELLGGNSSLRDFLLFLSEDCPALVFLFWIEKVGDLVVEYKH